MRARSIVLAIILLASIAFVPCARSETPAAEETIEVGGFTVTLIGPKVDFPDSIEFEMGIEDGSGVSDVTLQYRMDKLSVLPITNVAFPAFTAGRKATAEWKWDMTKTGGLPPGADLSYWWTIEDALGGKTDTPVRTLSFDDTRHQWREVQGSGLKLYWYDGDSAFAQKLVDAGEEALSLLEGDIGARPEGTVEVYIYGSTAALQDSLIYPDVWTGGLAFTEYGVIALGLSPAEVRWGESTMAHEMAHIVTHQATMSGYGVSMPTWLDEGLAMYAEGELSPTFANALKSAVDDGRLYSVRSLAGSFPADTSSALLAYAQSYSLVDYLLEHKGGRENMLGLLQAISNGSGYHEALQSVYALSVDQLDLQWKQYVMAGSV